MNILLGVTGGIAAYKSLELVRLCRKAGHEVQVVMTSGAKQFIQPLSFQALSGRPVRDQLFDNDQEAGMGHIELARWADSVVIAPCSAETLAKLRMGRADDLLTTLCLATDRPILVAPAMNQQMWANQATQENVSVLQLRGMEVIAPAVGTQACGEEGAGRMPEPLDILNRITELTEKIAKNGQAWSKLSAFWQGKRVLITAGPTYEAIDPVRFIGNRSSGKMGFALAEVAHKLGAEVTLVAGPVALFASEGIHRINVRTALQMFDVVQAHYAVQDVLISAAAVADFRPETVAKNKLKKSSDQDEMTLTLVKNPDIVAWVAQQTDKPFVVGFDAETTDLLAFARQKRRTKNLDLICANSVGETLGFDTADTALTLISEQGEVALPRATKNAQAHGVLEAIMQQWD